MLEEKGYNVIGCSASGEFMDSIENGGVDKIVLDFDAWQHGKSIYNYFKLTRKMADIPIVFYNAPDNFTALPERSHHQEDTILHKQVDCDELVGTV
jgi:DNA-binding NtrC family response regulator